MSIGYNSPYGKWDWALMLINLCKSTQVGYYSNPRLAPRAVTMHRQISAAALALLAILSFGSNLYAQGTSHLRVRVTVVPAVTARSSEASPLGAQLGPDAQLIWAAVQHAHIVTRNTNGAELSKNWLNTPNPCASEGTKVLRTSSATGSCEITINTVEFVAE